jgi:hypothetical protein
MIAPATSASIEDIFFIGASRGRTVRGRTVRRSHVSSVRSSGRAAGRRRADRRWERLRALVRYRCGEWNRTNRQFVSEAARCNARAAFERIRPLIASESTDRQATMPICRWLMAAYRGGGSGRRPSRRSPSRAARRKRNGRVDASRRNDWEADGIGNRAGPQLSCRGILFNPESAEAANQLA